MKFVETGRKRQTQNTSRVKPDASQISSRRAIFCFIVPKLDYYKAAKKLRLRHARALYLGSKDTQTEFDAHKFEVKD
jgi:hypothetical protein